MVKTFHFGDIAASEYGVTLTAPPPVVVAQRDVELVNVLGRDGDLLVDNKRYKTVRIPYECAILPLVGYTLRETINWFVSVLNQTEGYIKLENDFEPDHYRMAALLDEISVESIAERGGLFTLYFTCKPNRWRLDGELITALTTTPAALVNPTAHPARPLVTVYGTGPGMLYVGDAAVDIKSMQGGQITLDCETMNAYYRPGEGGYVSRNSAIQAPYYPELQPGNNRIRWTGGITSVKIIPRWWDL